MQCTPGVAANAARVSAHGGAGWGILFINFFLELRQARVPVSLREYLTLLEAMGAGVADYSVDDFIPQPGRVS